MRKHRSYALYTPGIMTIQNMYHMWKQAAMSAEFIDNKHTNTQLYY